MWGAACSFAILLPHVEALLDHLNKSHLNSTTERCLESSLDYHPCEYPLHSAKLYTRLPAFSTFVFILLCMFNCYILLPHLHHG